jgi:hypothetical protein
MMGLVIRHHITHGWSFDGVGHHTRRTTTEDALEETGFLLCWGEVSSFGWIRAWREGFRGGGWRRKTGGSTHAAGSDEFGRLVTDFLWYQVSFGAVVGGT